MTDNYAEIEIYIRPQTSPDVYPVEARLDDGSFEKAELLLPRKALLEAEHLFDPEKYGLTLFDALFFDSVRKAYDNASGWAEREKSGRLRVRLWIDNGAAELHAIPWERLYHVYRGQVVPLTTSPLTPFSRFLAFGMATAMPVTERPLRILAAIANPTDLTKELSPVNVEEEVENLLETFAPFNVNQDYALTLLPGRTGLSDDLRARFKAAGFDIDEGPTSLTRLLHLLTEFHVFHFIGHGYFLRSEATGPGTAYLILENDDGTTKRIEDKSLIKGLVNLKRQPQLVFLTACESAKTNSDLAHPFVGLAPRLVEAGIPAVVAMQELVGMKSARQLTADFYKQLLEHGVVDVAHNEARHLLWAQDDPYWSVPVLFMRLDTGQLFAPQIGKAPFMVDELPDDYVPRPVEIKRLKELTLDAAGKSLPVTVALHGFGGFGKTTLARAFCHEFRDRFPGGVLWVTLGETPGDLTRRVEDLIYGLTGERPGFTELTAAISRFKTILGNQRVLIVIDDVWNEAHLEPFLQGGPNCTRLITTRITTTLPSSAALIDVGAMLKEEAVALLTIGLDSAGSEAELEELASWMGNWPLLLRLVNAALREQVNLGSDLPEALLYVRSGLELEGFDAFDAEKAEQRDQAVAISLGVSLNLLAADEQERLLELAIFPEDTDVALTAVGRLWEMTGGMNLFRIRQLCTRLVRLSLLQRYDAGQQVLRLHDIMRKYLLRRLGTEKAAELHVKLVDAWGDLRLPGPGNKYDPYALRWVIYHLAEAAAASVQPERHQLTSRLVGLISKHWFIPASLTEVNDLTGLRRDLLRSLELTADDDMLESAPMLVGAGVIVDDFNTAHMRPEPMFKIAREGRLETALARIESYDIEEHWKQVTSLTLAWLAANTQPEIARKFHQEIGLNLVEEREVVLLWERMDTALNKAPLRQLEPLPDLPPVEEDIVEAIVKRIGGADADVELLTRHELQFQPQRMGHAGAILFPEPGYLSQKDGPVLVSYAAQHPDQGKKQLLQYIRSHQTYAYAYYRRQSLWHFLWALLQHPDPDSSFLPDMLPDLCIAALTGSRLDFRESLPLTVRALQARNNDSDARTSLDKRCDTLFAEAVAMGASQPVEPFAANMTSMMMVAGPDLEITTVMKDPWARQKRLMAALAEAFTLLAMMEGDDTRAAALVSTALDVPHSNAGFQAPACLSLAESISICRPGDFAVLAKALEEAQEAAHNIQDAQFCARLTARVNAMRAFWWPFAPEDLAYPPAFELEDVVNRLRQHPDSPEFASLHYIEHSYEGRSGVEMSLPLPVELLEAHSLEQVAEAFKQSLPALEKLNNNQDTWNRLAEITTNPVLKDLLRANAARDWRASDYLDTGVPVLIPDSGFAVHIATRLSARALTDPELAQPHRHFERIRIIQKLAPVAALNATALYTLLSRLLLAVGLMIPLPLDALAELAPYSEAEPEDGLTGELTAIQQLTTFVP